MTSRRQVTRSAFELVAVTLLGLAVLLAAGTVVSLLQVEGALRVLLGVYVLLGGIPAGRAVLWLARRGTSRGRPTPDTHDVEP